MTIPALPSPPRIAFAGDRAVAVRVLDVLIDDGVDVVALALSSPERASHDQTLRERCAHLSDQVVFRGTEIRTPEAAEQLANCAPDVLLSVHFPYLVPAAILKIPHVAPLNLHPAYLPYNRGWHTPSWALLDGTPYGATLHVMTEDLDAGPIVQRELLSVRPHDTAHTLYQRVQDLEVQLFKEAWNTLQAGKTTLTRPTSEGTHHSKSDLHQPAVQQIDPDANVRAGDLLTRLRALTTNRVDEAAYIRGDDGTRYRLQLHIVEEGDAT